MKVVKNILSVFLALTILSTFVGKTLHELLFHNHEEIHCKATTTKHYHEQKSLSTDLVCSFNLSVSLTTSFESGKVVLNELCEQLLGTLQIFCNNLFLSIKSLRAPPAY